MEITKISPLPTLEKRLKVAAYARVSCPKDAMLESLSAQISHYSTYIQSKAQWQYTGVYADEAITGTKENRAEFQRLIRDCRNGDVDLILTKSISRFARNTVVLLETVRELKSLGIAVIFEEQNINTLSSDGELMLSILASYAQEESLSASENQKWRVKRNFEAGKTWGAKMYGYGTKDGVLIIIPHEAEVIRQIYADYLAGFGIEAIMKKLNENRQFTRKNMPWNKNTIKCILQNYAYTGNLVLQQTYVENHLSKKKMKNEGQLPKYHAEHSHEAIVDMEIFDKVQERLKQQADKFSKRGKQHKLYPFSGLLVCATCGKKYRRKTTAHGIVWICTTYNTLGKAHCPSKQVPDEILTTITSSVADVETIDYIEVANSNWLFFHLSDGTVVHKQWHDRSRSQSWTEEMKQTARERRKTNA